MCYKNTIIMIVQILNKFTYRLPTPPTSLLYTRTQYWPPNTPSEDKFTVMGPLSPPNCKRNKLLHPESPRRSLSPSPRRSRMPPPAAQPLQHPPVAPEYGPFTETQIAVHYTPWLDPEVDSEVDKSKILWKIPITPPLTPPPQQLWTIQA